MLIVYRCVTLKSQSVTSSRRLGSTHRAALTRRYGVVPDSPLLAESPLGPAGSTIHSWK